MSKRPLLDTPSKVFLSGLFVTCPETLATPFAAPTITAQGMPRLAAVGVLASIGLREAVRYTPRLIARLQRRQNSTSPTVSG